MVISPESLNFYNRCGDRGMKGGLILLFSHMPDL